MSKIINQLTPEDFGKSFDSELFSKWKKSVEEHEKAGLINIVLYLIGLAALIVISGLVGIVLFFGFAISGIAIALPKQKKRKGYQRELGITNAELKEAINQCRNQTKVRKSVPTQSMKAVLEETQKTDIVLVHKIGSMYHRIDEEQKIIGDYAEIGREAKCQVCYDDHFETVSRRHAALMKDDNQWKLFPLSRTNPTFINGTMVQKEWYLQHGDEIQCAVNGPKLVFMQRSCQ